MADWGFWIAAGAMCFVVLAVLAQALRRGASAGPARDMPVYRDQLAEIDRDLARGTLDPAEAERLRQEVSRRLLDADRADKSTRLKLADNGMALALVIVAVVVAGSVWAYLRLGAPGFADLPLSTRLAMAQTAYENRPSQAQTEAALPALPARTDVDPAFLDLMAKLRAAMIERPNDVEGLTLLARNEAALGNFAAAHAAQARLIAAKGDAATADDHAALAEAMIMAAGGAVSPQAEAALIRTLEIDPTNGTARYYSGLMFAQVGRPDRTFALWRPLLDQSPADAPWTAPIRTQLQDVADAAGIDYALPAAAKGPSTEDIDAAADMTPEDRQAMIEGMVAQLADRLASEGGPVADWAKLINALAVLGQMDRATEVYTKGQATFAGKDDDLVILKAAAAEAGIIQ